MSEADIGMLHLLADIVAEESGARRHGRLTRATRAIAVPGWDSLSHARIMLSLEDRLGVRIDIARSYEFDDLGGLLDYLAGLTRQADA